MRSLRLLFFHVFGFVVVGCCLSPTEVTNKEEFESKVIPATRVPNVILKTVNSRDYLMTFEGAFFILVDVECYLFSC